MKMETGGKPALRTGTISRRLVVGGGLAIGLLPSLAMASGRNDAFLQAVERLSTYIDAKMAEAHIPGLAIGLAHKGAVRLTRSFGFADLEAGRGVSTSSMFHIASITKPMIATAYLQMAEKGLLKLDDPVGKYCDFPVVNPHHPDVPITIRQLLNHSSSISDAATSFEDSTSFNADSKRSLRQSLADYLVPGGVRYSAQKCFSKDRPGQTWSYSNIGYGLLGYLGGLIAGEDMRTVIDRDMFKPLGMKNTSWTIANTPCAQRVQPYAYKEGGYVKEPAVGFAEWAAGMLRCSVDDYTRFLAASSNRGRAGGFRLIGPESVQQMLTRPELDGFPEWMSGQGLGWSFAPLDGKAHPSHYGGDPGVFTATYLDPANRSGVVVMMNVYADAPRRDLVKVIARRLFALATAA